MRLIGTVAILAASMLAGTALSQQPSTAGQASAAKAESAHQHGCKDMKAMKDKHADRHGGEKGAHSEKHADCGPGAKEKQKAKGGNGHDHDKSHKHS